MNTFYLIAGLMLILLSLAYALWGERKLFNLLTPNVVSQETIVSLYVPWHQVTFLLFSSGLALLLSAFRDELAYLPYFVLTIIIGNFAIFILICILKRQTELFGKTLPQTILFSLLIILILLGILS